MNKSTGGATVWGLALCAAIAALCAMTPLQSAGAVGAYTAEKFSAAPPPEVSAAVRETLSNDGIRVQGPNGPLCEIWPRKAIPVNASPSSELGVAFGEFAEGTLAAVVRFPAEVIDYRKQRVKAGVYTLRYALNPVNGNHQGVAPQRDFLLASPAADDQSVAVLSVNDLINLSKKVTGANHASVWSLGPVEDQPKALPAINHQDDGDLWLVEFPLNFLGPSNTLTVKSVALVVVGHAPEA
jgi:hypothetical protein